MDRAAKNALHPRMLGMETDGKIKLEVWADDAAAWYHATKDARFLDREGNPHPRPGALRMVACEIGVPDPARPNAWSVYSRDAVAAGRPRRPRRHGPLRPGRRRQRPEEGRAVGRRPHRPLQLRDRQRPDRRHRGRRARPAPGPGLHDPVVEPDPVRAVARADHAPGQPEPRGGRATCGRPRAPSRCCAPTRSP